MEKVFVTGMGIVSAIGTDLNSSLKSLQDAKSGIGLAKHFKSSFSENINFGEVDLSNDELIKITNSTSEKGLSRTTLLAYKAIQEAIEQAGLSDENLRDNSTGFISSSTVGGMSNTDELYADANKTGEPSEYIQSYGGGAHTLNVLRKFNINGFSTTINTACSSSANAIMLGARLIKSGRLKRVIVGGSDSLAKYTVNGFNALMILSDNPCRPFDNERDGLTLGEGAAYLILEGESVCEGKNKIVEVKGYGNANDAFHPSATSDEAFGPRLAMSRALETAQLAPKHIDYINAHGTGTPNNDQTEIFAFTETFDEIPPFNSTKSYTGHTLAAAGSIEAVFSILSLNSNTVFPSLRCETPIPPFNIFPVVKDSISKSMNHVMSNSFGFGGNCTTLILSKVECT